MKLDPTTCDYGANPSLKAFNCEREEQCDDCFMVDHLKECSGCDHYDHPVTPLFEAMGLPDLPAFPSIK